MGYYDFDDHFWAAHEVCGQQPEIVARKIRFFSLHKLVSSILKKDSDQDNLKSHNALTTEKKNLTQKKGGIQPK